MSDHLNQTGLRYLWNRLKTIFATKAEVSTLSQRVDDIVAEGGEPNVIETVKVNGTALAVDGAKAVDISVPTQVTDLEDGDAVALKTYVDENGGKIDKIKVNGAEQPISGKAVDISVPVKTSDLANDSTFLTEAEVDAKVNAAVTSVYRLKDPVPTVADLPATGNVKGDVRDVQETGMNYEWTGSEWEPMGHLIDTSAFWSKTELTAITTEQIDAIIDGT